MIRALIAMLRLAEELDGPRSCGDAGKEVG